MTKDLYITINHLSFKTNQHTMNSHINDQEKKDIETAFKMRLPTHVKVQFLPKLIERMNNTLEFVQTNNISNVRFLSGFIHDEQHSCAQLYADEQYIVPQSYYDETIEKSFLIYEEAYFYISYSSTRQKFKLMFDWYLDNNQFLSFESNTFLLD